MAYDVGYVYYLSKRTQLYGYASMITNTSHSTQGFGLLDAYYGTVTPGFDPWWVTAGLRTSFWAGALPVRNLGLISPRLSAERIPASFGNWRRACPATERRRADIGRLIKVSLWKRPAPRQLAFASQRHVSCSHKNPRV
ncbi:hypothetical protein LMG27177_07582 [Paraburkholderia fynbosensis]|uniref:Porin domain-containing protein n=2 Tax=Paraburkholderia fynbosensis TaxID=1200993 RepID=A0A6J5H5H6_9BURK|nr:hypothetical protein LMG27177_07582 [Paraburkholderia fynbosensis]